MIEPYMRPAKEGVFRAIVWKEWHEGLKSAIVGSLIVGLGEVIGHAIMDSFDVSTSASFSFGDGPSIPLSLFTLTTALAALMIGGAGSVRESRGDRWGFLTHRPATRSMLFWGKTLAGASLYLVAAATPLIGRVLWRLVPGHSLGPFDARMLLPSVADLSCGFVYYFVGFLVGMREARWLASRALPIIAATLSSFMVILVPTFWSAMTVVALAIALTATAAHGAFVAGGQYEPQRTKSRAALALTMGIGIQLGILIVGVAIEALSDFERASAREIRSTHVVVTAKGDVVKMETVYHAFRASQDVVAVTDLNGTPLANYQSDAARSKLTAGVISTADLPLNPKDRYGIGFRDRGYRGIDDVAVHVRRSPNVDRDLSWFFIRRAGLLAAYNIGTKRFVGWMGPDGFSLGRTEPLHRFQGPLGDYTEPGYWQSVIAFPAAVYRLDLEHRRLQRIFTPPVGERVLSAVSSGDTAKLSTEDSREKFDVIATDKAVYVQAFDGTSQQRVPRDSSGADGKTVVVSRPRFVPGAPTFLEYKPEDPGDASETRQLGQILQLDEAGAVVARHALPPLDSTVANTNADWGSATIDGLSASLVVSLVGEAVSRSQAKPGTAATPMNASDILDWVLSAIVSLAAAVIAFFVARARGFDKRRSRLWMTLSFLFAAVGVLTMVALIDRPARERCPTCHRKRVVTRDSCEHCGAEWPAPQSDGIEIFELSAI